MVLDQRRDVLPERRNGVGTLIARLPSLLWALGIEVAAGFQRLCPDLKARFVLHRRYFRISAP
jgi:hypothetical protein